MSLKKSRAWFYFASYIKARDKYTCFVCGKKEKGQGMHAGHFIQAHGHQNTFFDPTNVHAECAFCNGWDTSSLLTYRRKIIEKYGEGYDLELERLGKIYKCYTKKELKELAGEYKQKLKALENV